MSRLIAASWLFLAATFAYGSTRPQYGGTLRVATVGDPDAVARPLVFDRLVAIGPRGEVIPGLASRWQSENQFQRWQFWLRSGIRFHDGAELTAEDVVRSLGEACSPSCPWRTLRAAGASVVLTTDSPAPTMPEELGRSMYGIGHRAGGETVGTGPFRIGARSRDSLSLVAVEDCWSGRPFVDSIEIDGHREARTELLDLSVGRADLVDVPPEMMGQAKQSHISVLTSQPVDLLALTIRGPSLDTPQARASVAYAVDRAALWSVIYQRQGEPSASILPNSLSGYSFLFPAGRNIARALELAAGIRGVLTLSADTHDSLLELTAERLALNLHEAGLNVQVRDSSARKPDLLLERFHLEAGGQRAALHEMLRQLGTDCDDRDGGTVALYQAERTFLADHTVVPLVWLPRSYAVGSRVRALELGSDGTPMLAGVSLKVAP